MSITVKSKFDKICEKIMFLDNVTRPVSLFGQTIFLPSMYNESNGNVAGSLGGAIDTIFKNTQFSHNDVTCDVLCIAGISKFILNQKEKGNTQLITFIAANSENGAMQSYTLFISKEGDMIPSYALESHLNDDYEFNCFLVPIDDSNGWRCTWRKINKQEMRDLLNEIKQFVNV